jgi:hypothetical protein
MTRRRCSRACILYCPMIAYGLTAFGSPSLTLGSEVDVKVSANVQISTERHDVPHYEVVIAADPKDPRYLLVGSCVAPVGNVAYVTTNGGRTWSLSLDRRNKSSVDPSVAFGPDGFAYFADLTGREAGVAVFRSTDHGLKWSVPVQIKDMLDRPFLAVDCGESRFGGRVFLNCQVSPPALHFPDVGRPLSRVNGCILYTSDDGAHTFTTTLVRLAVPPFRIRGAVGGIMLQDGQYLLPYDYYNSEQKTVPGVRPSIGAISTLRLGEGGRIEIDSSRIAPQTMVTDEDGIPTFAADVYSATLKGHLYGVWSEMHEGRHQVWLASSANSGLRWSKPRVISDLRTADAFMPSVAVNREGIVGVCWYDTRNATPGSGDWDVYFRASPDGGSTWERPVRITEKTSVAKTRSDAHLGDTAGIAPDVDGVFHPVWVDNRTGVLQVWTTAVTVKSH